MLPLHHFNGNISSCCEQGATFTVDTYKAYFIIPHEWTYI